MPEFIVRIPGPVFDRLWDAGLIDSQIGGYYLQPRVLDVLKVLAAREKSGAEEV
jgi:hypothetical protein